MRMKTTCRGLFTLVSCLSVTAYLCTSYSAPADPPPGNWTQTFNEPFNVATSSITTTPNPYGYDYPKLDTGYHNPPGYTNFVWNIGPTAYDHQQDVESGYSRNNVSVQSDGLHLTVKHEAIGNAWWAGPPVYNYNYAFSSGYIETYQKWTQRYGYFEAAIKMPSGVGFWPAFWLYTDRGTTSPDPFYEDTQGNSWSSYGSYRGPTSDYGNEIDIVEYLSTWQTYASANQHFPNGGNGNDHTQPYNTSFNPSDGFHAYGVYWGPAQIEFYIDGVRVYGVDQPSQQLSQVASAPCYMILNCGVTYNDWIGTSYGESQVGPLPQDMIVQSVKAWQGAPAPPASNLLYHAQMSASSPELGQMDYTTGAYDPFSVFFATDGLTTSDQYDAGWRSGRANASAGNTETLTADMGASYQINNVTLYPRTDSPGAGFPVNFTISTSNDGYNFTPAISPQTNYPNPNLSGNQPQQFYFNSPVTARYVQITGTNLSLDPYDNTYRMSFAEVTATMDSTHTSRALIAVDPFTSPENVSYNFYNGYHVSGNAAASDFGSVASGVWSPNVTGCNTEHFVVNNAAVQLANVGDYVSLAVKTTASDNPAIGLVLSAGLAPSSSVNQTELLLQRFSDGYCIANYTSHNGMTVPQTDYATMTVMETAYNSSTQVRTFSVTLSGGGIAPMTTSAYLTGANCYVGLGAFSNYHGMEGATAKNFVFTPATTASQMVGHVIALQSLSNGLYVCADNSGTSPLIANRGSYGTWEEYKVVDAGGGLIALQSLSNNYYVCADNYGNNPLIANRSSYNAWEEFQVVDAGGGHIALQSLSNGLYVCADNYGNSPLIANRGSYSGWEEYNVIIVQ